MIQVRCSVCQASFQAEDESAGRSEFCPSCGTLNDVPAPVLPSQTIGDELRWPSQGAGSGRMGRHVRRILAAAAIAAFVVICWIWLGDNWESRHAQSLADSLKRADELAAAGDVPDARVLYQGILTEVGNRNLQSVFLKEVLARARHGLEPASNASAAVAKPQTNPATP